MGPVPELHPQKAIEIVTAKHVVFNNRIFILLYYLVSFAEPTIRYHLLELIPLKIAYQLDNIRSFLAH